VSAAASTGALERAAAPSGPTGLIGPLLLSGVAMTLVLFPLVGVLASFVDLPASRDTLLHLLSTVIPRAAAQTTWLAALVLLGVAVLGTTSAWLVTACDFPGRRLFEWALVVPLAMPAYIVAYAYTDFLQFAGPVQSTLRETFGWRFGDYWFPEIRSVPGAAFVLTVTLYPYVYLLARTAFLSRTASMADAARSLGLSPTRTWLAVNLPLARPAVAAGCLLALMETLADYGTVAYFGLQTFTTAIYRAWFSMGDRMAASQLASFLLAVVLVMLIVELRARGRARFFTAAQGSRPAPRVGLDGARAWTATLACLLPIAAGFLLPMLILLDLARGSAATIETARFLRWLWHSVLLGGLAAVLVVAVALLLAYAVRLAAGPRAARLAAVAVRCMSLGYAAPGIVVAVGILIPLATLDNRMDAWLRELAGISTGLLFTGTLTALLYAYLVRYFAVAHQPIEAGLARITPAMDASARSLGAPPAEVWRRVHLPLLAPSLAAAALLVFVDVMKELPATLVLRPFDYDTLAVVAYQFAADERLGEAALPALTIAIVGLLPVILLSRAMARGAQADGTLT
jgi:iron(III) transport system permease protein